MASVIDLLMDFHRLKLFKLKDKIRFLAEQFDTKANRPVIEEFLVFPCEGCYSDDMFRYLSKEELHVWMFSLVVVCNSTLHLFKGTIT